MFLILFPPFCFLAEIRTFTSGFLILPHYSALIRDKVKCSRVRACVQVFYNKSQNCATHTAQETHFLPLICFVDATEKIHEAENKWSETERNENQYSNAGITLLKMR